LLLLALQHDTESLTWIEKLVVWSASSIL